MSEEKKIILKKIDELIIKKRSELLKSMPSIHEIDDGIVIRFFTNWDDCINDIKYKKIINQNNSEEFIVFYFIPKGAIIEHGKRDYIKCITCLSGKLELNVGNEIFTIEAFNKIHLKSDEFRGIAIEDTYVVTSNKC
jgi:hypothetical protein